MLDDRTQLDESDLLFHSRFNVMVHGGETVWIGDISGDDPDRAPVSLGFKNLTIEGELVHVLDRLRAAVSLLERAQASTEEWDLLLPRRRRKGLTDPRTWAHPFRDPPRPPPAEIQASEN